MFTSWLLQPSLNCPELLVSSQIVTKCNKGKNKNNKLVISMTAHPTDKYIYENNQMGMI